MDTRRFGSTPSAPLPARLSPPAAALPGDADRAEELLLGSSRASAAVEMRQGLGHWERAIELAGHLQPHALGGLALLRAQALEAEGQVGRGGACEFGLHPRSKHSSHQMLQ